MKGIVKLICYLNKYLQIDKMNIKKLDHQYNILILLI